MNDPLKSIPNLKGIGLGNSWIAPVKFLNNNRITNKKHMQELVMIGV